MTINDEEHPATGCIVINQDGNQFYALIGPNLQEGHIGFGDTPLSAILDLISNPTNAALKEILNQKPDSGHWTYLKEEINICPTCSLKANCPMNKTNFTSVSICVHYKNIDSETSIQEE